MLRPIAPAASSWTTARISWVRTAESIVFDRAISTRFRPIDSRRRYGASRRLAYALEDSVRNMRVIDAVFRAALSGRWEGV